MSNQTNTSRFPTTNRAQAEVAALLMLDTTVDCKLTEAAQFARYQAKLAADRAAVAARFAEPKADVEARKLSRVLAALAR